MAALSELAASSLRARGRSSRRHRLHNPARSLSRPRIRALMRRAAQGWLSRCRRSRGADGRRAAMPSWITCDVWHEWNWKWFGWIHRRYQYRGYTDGNAHHWWSRVYRNPGCGRNSGSYGSDSCSRSDSGSHSDSDSDSRSDSGSRSAGTRFRQTTRRWRNPRERVPSESQQLAPARGQPIAIRRGSR